MRLRTGGTIALGVTAMLVVGLPTSAAGAVEFDRTLKRGMSGRDVKALQVRLAGWYPGGRRERFVVDGDFGAQTVEALTRFESHYGVPHPDGVAGRRTFAVIERLTDPDGSTAHFTYAEFKQHENAGCSAQANAYSGTFDGGGAAKRRVKRNVRRLMWRLEALRAKAGGGAVGINSGFRSLPYNTCIGGAATSQHLFGTAADNRVAGITNDRARLIARRSQFHGIACYSNTTHNHFDLRYENSALPSARAWWWPDVDSMGRELDEDNRPCWGESGGSTTAQARAPVASAVAGIALVPTGAEVRAFEEAGEPLDLNGAD